MGKAEEGHFHGEGNVLKCSQTCTRHFSDANMATKTILPDREVGSCEGSEQDSEDDSPADKVLGGMLLRTASGRAVIGPNRLDLSHETLTSCFSFCFFLNFLKLTLQDIELIERLNFCTTMFFL